MYKRKHTSCPLRARDQKFVDISIQHPYVIVEHLIHTKQWALIWCYSLRCICKDSPQDFRNLATGICSHSATRAFMRLGSDVGTTRLPSPQLSFHSSFCAPKSKNHFFVDLASCTSELWCWNRKVSSTSKSPLLSKISTFSLESRFPLMRTYHETQALS